jgi:hypothetical protein
MMGRLVSLLVLVWIIGIAVELAPRAQAGWDTETASELVAGMVDQLPYAAAWPVRAVETLRAQA